MSEHPEFSKILPAQRWIHWATVLMLIAVLFATMIREAAESKLIRSASLSIHELCGLAVLTLTVLRIFVVATGRRAGIVRGVMPRMGHTLLYLFLLYQPVIGLFVAQATGGKALNIFSLQLPQLLPADEDFSTALLEVHEFVGWAFLALIVGHVAMAIWHVYVQRDGYAREMMPVFVKPKKKE